MAGLGICPIELRRLLIKYRGRWTGLFLSAILRGMNMKKTVVLAFLVVFSTSSWAFQGDAQKGKVIATSVCFACHGADGVSPIPTQPNLAAQLPDYIVKQLNNMKSVNGAPPARNNPIMSGIVSMLSEDDIRNVAAWYAAQPPKHSQATSPKLVAVGERLWRAGDADRGVPACSGCHGPTGSGIPALYPRLSGQYQEYTEIQLQHFKNGTRKNDPSGIMRAVAHRLSNEEIKALADFTAGLR